MSSTSRKKSDAVTSLDQYHTQPELAAAAMRQAAADGFISPDAGYRLLEPSVGAWAWVKAAIAIGWDPEGICAVDKDPSVALFKPPGVLAENVHAGVDFVEDERVPELVGRPDLIVGNPPYGNATPHIARALSILRPGGVLIQLLRDGYFAAEMKNGEPGILGSRRDWLWGRGIESRPIHTYLVSPRPSFTGTGQDSATYVVAVWRRAPSYTTTQSLLTWEKNRNAK